MDKIKNTYLFGLACFALATGYIYLWGYWATFHINFLEYVKFTEIVYVSLVPLTAVFLPVIAGSISGFGERFASIAKSPAAQSVGFQLTTLILFAVFVGVLVYKQESVAEKYVIACVFPLILAMLFSVISIQKGLPLWLILFFTAAVPVTTISCLHGKYKAFQIIESTEYFEANINGDPYKHLGLLGTHHIFITMDNKSITIVDAEELKTLKLTFHVNKPTPPKPLLEKIHAQLF